MFRHHGIKLTRGCALPLFMLLAGGGTAQTASPEQPAPPPAAIEISPAPPEVMSAASELRELRARLRVWATGRAMTTLAANAYNIDPKFVGVKRTLELVGKIDPASQVDVPALTFHNSDYWRGVMEMAPGNLLVASVPIVLFVANGQLDQAHRLATILRPFSQQGPLADTLLKEYAQRSDAYRGKLYEQIKRGIALHDQRRYGDAIALYREVLAACPDSVWARYELFFSDVTSRGATFVLEESRAPNLWPAAAAEIYGMDPLYEAQLVGQRGKTMASAFDRLALRELFSKPPEDTGAFYATYADLALKLEAYGFAAHLYWFSLHLKSDEAATEEKLTRFLYCLEKLGVTDLKADFKGDHTAAFARLDKELAEHRRM
jgi:hypothetical protein